MHKSVSNKYKAANQYLGLLKFFREKNHMEMFLDGYLYCNTPEYYRLSDAAGVSDRNESCVISVRESRGDPKLELSVEDKYVGEVSDLIIRHGRPDGWLHCWCALFLPENNFGFEELKLDVARLQYEFGPHYVYVAPKESHELVARIESLENTMVQASQVEYSEIISLNHSVFSKSNKFKYQHEYRFVFDECKNDCAEPKIFYVEDGFRDIASPSPKLEIMANTDKEKLELVLEYKLR